MIVSDQEKGKGNSQLIKPELLYPGIFFQKGTRQDSMRDNQGTGVKVLCPPGSKSPENHFVISIPHLSILVKLLGGKQNVEANSQNFRERVKFQSSPNAETCVRWPLFWAGTQKATLQWEWEQHPDRLGNLENSDALGLDCQIPGSQRKV